MANKTVTLNSTTLKLLVRELEHLEQIKKTLLKIIPESLLREGSELWWTKTIEEGLSDIKEANYTTIKNHQELDRFLDQLE